VGKLYFAQKVIERYDIDKSYINDNLNPIKGSVIVWDHVSWPFRPTYLRLEFNQVTL